MLHFFLILEWAEIWDEWLKWMKTNQVADTHFFCNTHLQSLLQGYCSYQSYLSSTHMCIAQPSIYIRPKYADGCHAGPVVLAVHGARRTAVPIQGGEVTDPLWQTTLLTSTGVQRTWHCIALTIELKLNWDVPRLKIDACLTNEQQENWSNFWPLNGTCPCISLVSNWVQPCVVWLYCVHWKPHDFLRTELSLFWPPLQWVVGGCQTSPTHSNQWKAKQPTVSNIVQYDRIVYWTFAF